MVMDQIVSVEEILTATDADFLAGTALDQPGVPGVYTVWAASDQADSLITINQGGRVIIDSGVIVQRANEEIREDQDGFYQMLSRTGGRPVINIVEVTAASIRVRVKFLPAVAT